MPASLRPMALLLVLAAGSARAGPTLAVAALDAPRNLAFTARSLSDAIAKKARSAGFEVIGPRAIEKRLGKRSYAALVRCADDAECLAESGRELGVQRIVGGSLLKRGTAYRVALVHVDAKSGALLGEVERETPVASRRLQKEVLDAVPTLLAGGQEEPGVLRVVTDEPGAEVAVDDRVVGTTPIVQAVRPGRHKVRVARRGFIDAEPAWVEVPAGEVVEHHPRLYRVPPRDLPNSKEDSEAVPETK